MSLVFRNEAIIKSVVQKLNNILNSLVIRGYLHILLSSKRKKLYKLTRKTYTHLLVLTEKRLSRTAPRRPTLRKDLAVLYREATNLE